VSGACLLLGHACTNNRQLIGAAPLACAPARIKPRSPPGHYRTHGVGTCKTQCTPLDPLLAWSRILNQRANALYSIPAHRTPYPLLTWAGPGSPLRH
jgi:hypothetical protein